MPVITWIMIAVSVLALWGSASFALYRTLADEERKLETIEEHGEIDTYSPQSLADLREWIEHHPNHSKADDAKKAYNDCVETLKEIKEPFYDWSDEEIESLETIEG